MISSINLKLQLPPLAIQCLPFAGFLNCGILGVSDQGIVNFPANRNRNRFAEPTSTQIEIGVVCEFQNLGIGIGIIFVRWKVFVNY